MSHRVECLTYAWHRAEKEFRDKDDVREFCSAAIDARGREMLSEGTVSCICPELPS